MSGISIMLLGTKPFELLSRLANFDEKKKHFIHCFNVLDYTIPTEEESITSRIYRSELRRVFRLLKRVDTGVPKPQLEQLRKHDVLQLDDIDLEINAWIQLVFDNKENYDSVYKFLSGDLTKSNVELVPLVNIPPDIVLHRGKKLAPLRYYYEKKELLERIDIPYYDKYADLEAEDLMIDGHEILETLELNEESYSALSNSDFLVILVSDLVSLGVFSELATILDQITNLPLKTVLVIPSELTKFDNFAEEEIFDLLGLGKSISKMVDNLSLSMDYIISPNQENGLREVLLESGYQIENDELADLIPVKNREFTDFLNSLIVESE